MEVDTNIRFKMARPMDKARSKLPKGFRTYPLKILSTPTAYQYTIQSTSHWPIVNHCALRGWTGVWERSWTSAGYKPSRPVFSFLGAASGAINQRWQEDQNLNVNGLLDTGADVTIIAEKDWPKGWPTLTPSIDIWGVGGVQIPKQSTFPLLTHGPEDDARRFAFTIPLVNAAEPARQYHWAVLPQSMKNRPTICQTMVSRILGSVRQSYPEGIIYHYMDDILTSTPDSSKLTTIHNSIAEALTAHGLEVALEKTEMTAPWRYLSLLLSARTFIPQKTDIATEVKTLNQLQVLLGNINWVRSYLGLSTDFLTPLFWLLRGDSDLSSPRQLTPKARQVLQEINQRISTHQFDGLNLKEKTKKIE
ncbi:endogenous retrovirus group K member 18 Pol protein-like protein [Willisornis vidua]|uniref:ribonuclease H n=1 Tax=Willisornis vidua TaxID=1566151 RepID=A0ABQ9CNQ0_9PASS|nr:endogenous retrovirus group K member 18 Pol protein-like protein [Willisornis vidua]